MTTFRSQASPWVWRPAAWVAVAALPVLVLISCLGSANLSDHPSSLLPPQPTPLADAADAMDSEGELDAAMHEAAMDAAPDAAGGADANPSGERWTDAHRSVDRCEDFRQARWAELYEDPHGSERKYGYDGYVFRRVAVHREIDGNERLHCVRVYHPPGKKSAAGKFVRIADRIDAAWYRLIENTLSRLPWLHLQAVHAFVIDDRPILHGIASFSREDPKHDARDGHTIWLNQRLFTGTNHWAPGNYGKYWAYHVQYDGTKADGQRADHDMFSPVLIHEIGHIVNYNVVNGDPADPTCPRCAWMCGDHENCEGLEPAEKEAYCATPYCTGFGYASGTENFAEMYRWYYQGSETRALLGQHFAPCFEVFDEGQGVAGLNGGREAPWIAGLGEVVGYRKTLWDSCQGRACRGY